MDPVVATLRARRRRHGLTQADVARALGTTQSAIARLEGGAVSPRLATLQSYARALGLDGVTIVDDPVATLASGVAACHRDGDVDGALRVIVQFLDETAGSDGAHLQGQLAREAPPTGRREWDAAIAAAVAWRAREAAVRVPGWTAAPGRYLDGPWFPVAEVLGRPVSLALAAYLWAAAPADFTGRGVIIDSDSLRSV